MWLPPAGWRQQSSHRSGRSASGSDSSGKNPHLPRAYRVESGGGPRWHLEPPHHALTLDAATGKQDPSSVSPKPSRKPLPRPLRGDGRETAPTGGLPVPPGGTQEHPGLAARALAQVGSEVVSALDVSAARALLGQLGYRLGREEGRRLMEAGQTLFDTAVLEQTLALPTLAPTEISVETLTTDRAGGRLEARGTWWSGPGAERSAFHGEPACWLRRGVLAGLATELLGREVTAWEEPCGTATGQPCVFRCVDLERAT